MKNSVVIKGNKYGIVLVLDASVPFDQLKINISSKFSEASKFFGKCQMAITFEGKELTPEEESDVINIIQENTDITIICVVDNDKFREELFKKSMDDKLRELSSNSGQFYKGTLRSGQLLESESSVVILGDVNPGAKIISSGNVVVLGTLKGTVYAGASGKNSSFVVALEMYPMQIRIGDVIARSGDNSHLKNQKPEAKIAFLEDDNIYIESLNKDVLNDIHFY